MKANELMLGDWLRTSRGIAKVIAVDKICLTFKIDGGDFDIDWDDEEEWFDAIPLTPEILEKNGFTRPNVRVQYFTESTDYYDVDIHEITDSIWCFEYQNCEAHFPPCLILIAHVHELQHALRLCGIEKEITI